MAITVGMPEKGMEAVGVEVSVGGNGEIVGRGVVEGGTMTVKVAVGIAVCV